MFKFSKKNKHGKENKKYKNIYELAVQNSEDFEKNNDYTEFTKETINIIENKIEFLSKQGIRRLTYCTEEFHALTDMEQVRKYLETQGFKIHKFMYFDFQYGIFNPKICLTADIRW